MKKPLMPKEFIKKVLINNIGDIVHKEYYWLAFALMAIGIEFLGKCLHLKYSFAIFTSKYLCDSKSSHFPLTEFPNLTICYLFTLKLEGPSSLLRLIL